MSRKSSSGGRSNASMRMANVTAYGGGIMAAILLLPPSHALVRNIFVDYVTGYYGSGFSWLASIFLFCLMAVLIAGLATIIIHTLIEIIRSKAHFLGSLFKFGSKGNYYD